jgi:hypothetical protein
MLEEEKKGPRMWSELFSGGNSLVDGRSNTQAVMDAVTPGSGLLNVGGGQDEAPSMMSSILSPEGLTAPVSPYDQAKQNHGDGFGFFMKSMLVAKNPALAGWLMPELSAANLAQYKADLKNYNGLMSSQLENEMLAQQVSPLEAMLDDDDDTNDLAAIRKLARAQPDVYGPVLREMAQSEYNPTPETYTEGDYQLNPETGNWELIQQSSLGNIKKTPMPDGFVPEPRMWSSDAREKAIGEADTVIFESMGRASTLQNLGAKMDEIGEENWTAGMAGELGEKWKELTGAQDAVSMARKQYEGIRTKQAVQNLPPGVASDKDIELVLAPFPTSFTNFKELRDYVGEMEAIEGRITEYKQFESRYLAQKGTRSGLQESWQSTLSDLKKNSRSAYFDGDAQTKDDDFDALWGK